AGSCCLRRLPQSPCGRLHDSPWRSMAVAVSALLPVCADTHWKWDGSFPRTCLLLRLLLCLASYVIRKAPRSWVLVFLITQTPETLALAENLREFLFCISHDN